MNSSPGFEPIFTESFAAIYHAKKKRLQPMAEAIQQGVDHILAAPQNNDGPMRHPHSGRRKKYVGKSSYRIVFAICAECRKLGKQRENGCEFCGEAKDNNIVFFHAGVKQERHGDYDL